MVPLPGGVEAAAAAVVVAIFLSFVNFRLLFSNQVPDFEEQLRVPG